MKRRIYTIATAALTAAMAFGTGGCGKGQKTNYTSVEPDYSAAADTSVMHIGAWVAPRPRLFRNGNGLLYAGAIRFGGGKRHQYHLRVIRTVGNRQRRKNRQ